MRHYSVHVRPAAAAPDDAAVFVRDAFSWPAFLFTAAWALWHRMWVAAAALGVLGGAIGVAGAALAPAVLVVVALAVGAGVGLLAADLRRWSLARAGYVERAMVSARDRAAAEQRYFDAAPGPR